MLKLSHFWLGLLAALMIICAVMLPRREGPTSILETRSIPKTPSHSETSSQDSRLPHPNSPASEMAARLRQELTERRSRQEERKRNLQAEVEKTAKLTGLTTNEVRRQWEFSLIPQAEKERRWAAEKAQQREEELAKGVHVELWAWEDKLDTLSVQLKKGMSLQAVGQLLGSPSKAQAQVLKPGLRDLVPVPLDQVEQFQGPLTLVYSPDPKKVGSGSFMSDMFRVMHVDFGADKTLIKVSYRTFGPF